MAHKSGLRMKRPGTFAPAAGINSSEEQSGAINAAYLSTSTDYLFTSLL